MKEIVQCGVKILVDAAGTTPAYIQKTVDTLRSFSFQDICYFAQKPLENNYFSKKKIFYWEKIKSKKKDYCWKLFSCRYRNFFLYGRGKSTKHLGVDAITIAYCPIARARVDSSLLACKLKRELDITPIPHMTCRDRNINATKALLLGIEY